MCYTVEVYVSLNILSIWWMKFCIYLYCGLILSKQNKHDFTKLFVSILINLLNEFSYTTVWFRWQKIHVGSFLPFFWPEKTRSCIFSCLNLFQPSLVPCQLWNLCLTYSVISFYFETQKIWQKFQIIDLLLLLFIFHRRKLFYISMSLPNLKNIFWFSRFNKSV